MCNFKSFPTIFITISVYKKLEKLQQEINKQLQQPDLTKCSPLGMGQYKILLRTVINNSHDELIVVTNHFWDNQDYPPMSELGKKAVLLDNVESYHNFLIFILKESLHLTVSPKS